MSGGLFDLDPDLTPPDRMPPVSAPRRAAVVAGIDEAGLGPMLGPLCLGFTALRADTHALWERLPRSCSAEARERDGRLAVADSKEVYTRDARGAARLESTALAFLSLAGTMPAPHSAQQLFAGLPPDLAPQDSPEREPWHGHHPARLPWAAKAAQLAEQRLALARELEEGSIELLEAGFRALAPAELNRSFARTQSKSRTQWEALSPFFQRLWQRHASQGVDLIVDRQGGRMRYAALLDATIPLARTRIVAEESERSEYLVEEHQGPRWMRIVFQERAESVSFPVALASCLAKYARETWMEGFNAYFASLQSGLLPTAGYVTDARRWLEDAGPALALCGLERTALVRER